MNTHSMNTRPYLGKSECLNGAHNGDYLDDGGGGGGGGHGVTVAELAGLEINHGQHTVASLVHPFGLSTTSVIHTSE